MKLTLTFILMILLMSFYNIGETCSLNSDQNTSINNQNEDSILYYFDDSLRIYFKKLNDGNIIEEGMYVTERNFPFVANDSSIENVLGYTYNSPEYAGKIHYESPLYGPIDKSELGFRTGKWKEYYFDGSLKSVKYYDDGFPIGTWRFYTQDGKLDDKKYFYGDSIVYDNALERDKGGVIKVEIDSLKIFKHNVIQTHGYIKEWVFIDFNNKETFYEYVDTDFNSDTLSKLKKERPLDKGLFEILTAKNLLSFCEYPKRNGKISHGITYDIEIYYGGVSCLINIPGVYLEKEHLNQINQIIEIFNSNKD